MTSLEGWGSAIELHPRVPVGRSDNSLACRDRLVVLPSWVAVTVRGVAQFGSALALGARGRRFKSGHPDLAALTSRNPGQGLAYRWRVPGWLFHVIEVPGSSDRHAAEEDVACLLGRSGLEDVVRSLVEQHQSH